jgi:hypothetical protein
MRIVPRSGNHTTPSLTFHVSVFAAENVSGRPEEDESERAQVRQFQLMIMLFSQHQGEDNWEERAQFVPRHGQIVANEEGTHLPP